ncbi:MAG TPA: RNA 3'-terminal phosphate cyclase [Acidilobales archaeon]|nr:RNA 3'-terminal phosphate cyclase [Acidilobales archaeon]
MTLVIDGSYGEGGGQILRTSIALSCITGKPVKIINIRAKRPEPGLKRQHMTAIQAASTLCNAEVEGLRLGSTTIVFKPGSIRSGSFRFDIGTAGSITLVLQTLLLIAAYTEGSTVIEIRGGTDVPWSPPVDYLRYVIGDHLKSLGYEFKLDLLRRGHYPRGGGLVRVYISNPPRGFKSIELVKRGRLLSIEGISHCVRLPKHVAERQARAAYTLLSREGIKAPINIKLEWYEQGKDPHLGPGSGIVLWAKCDNTVLGGDSLGAKGKRAEVVGEEAAKKLINALRSGMALDKHMSDNIIPYIALAEGVSRIGGEELSMHAFTNIWLVKKILGVEVELEGELGKPFILKIRGAGIRF